MKYGTAISICQWLRHRPLFNALIIKKLNSTQNATQSLHSESISFRFAYLVLGLFPSKHSQTPLGCAEKCLPLPRIYFNKQPRTMSESDVEKTLPRLPIYSKWRCEQHSFTSLKKFSILRRAGKCFVDFSNACLTRQRVPAESRITIANEDLMVGWARLARC